VDEVAGAAARQPDRSDAVRLKGAIHDPVREAEFLVRPRAGRGVGRNVGIDVEGRVQEVARVAVVASETSPSRGCIGQLVERVVAASVCEVDIELLPVHVRTPVWATLVVCAASASADQSC
jgi:hypothetical protein